MKKKGYKGRCEKRSLSKCVGVCRTYSDLQSAYADVLEADPQVKEFQCNVLLEGLLQKITRIRDNGKRSQSPVKNSSAGF